MSSLRLDRFVRPSILQSIAPGRLIQFLLPHIEFLQKRGLHLVASNRLLEKDIERLTRILATPNKDIPHSLLDAIHLVNETANPRCMEEILSRISARELGFDLDARLTPADVAVQAWITNRSIIEAIHAEQFLTRPRSFESFQAMSYDPPEIKQLASDEHEALEWDLNDWFYEKNCGRGCKVFVFPGENAVHFMIRHGEPMRREETLEDSEVSSVLYRPLKYDVVVYGSLTGELRIHTESKRQKELYRRLFGKHLFGNEHLFPESARYSLEPLYRYGKESLSCTDIAEMISARLVELQILLGGSQDEILTHKAKDLFQALEERQGQLPTAPKILRGKFELAFADSKRPRSITIRPPNVAIYARDCDAAIVEYWLQQRGFIQEGQTVEHDQLQKILAKN